MTASEENVMDRARSTMSGLVLGIAFGIAGSTLLHFSLGGFLFFLPFARFAPFVAGPLVGLLLARLDLLPRLPVLPMIAFALVIASAPYVSGTLEIGIREDPFPYPSDAEVRQESNLPGGERTVFLESASDVPAFFDQLVAAAQSAGWECESCFFQSSTGTGHATLRAASGTSGSARGHLGFEVWRGGPGYYDSPPSELTLARVFHDRRTASPRYVFLATLLLFLSSVLVRLLAKFAR